MRMHSVTGRAKARAGRLCKNCAFKNNKPSVIPPNDAADAAQCFQATTTPLIIVATFGTGGDMAPYAALAQGLRERGHRVLMLVPAFHEALMQSEGLPYALFGSVSEFHAALNDPHLWDERKGFSVVWKGLQPHFGVLRDLVQRQPADTQCVVLCHPMLVPMAAIAKQSRADTRIVCAYLAPSNLCGSHDFLTAGSLPIPCWAPLACKRMLWRLIHKVWIDPGTLPSLNRWRLAHQLPAVPSIFAHIHQSPDASIGLFPDWLAGKQADWPTPFTEGHFPYAPHGNTSQLQPDLEQFLAQGEAPHWLYPRHRASPRSRTERQAPAPRLGPTAGVRAGKAALRRDSPPTAPRPCACMARPTG